MLEANGKSLCMNCFAEITKEPCHICGYGNSEIDIDSTILPVGTILSGKYAIGKLLGRGGFGITYLGYNLVDGKKVAIKEYFPDSLAFRKSQDTLVSSYMGSNKDELFKGGAEKFYEEAKTLSRFNGHPNIINVYEFFYENNTAYFVMEYVEGIDLKTYVKQNEGRLSYQKAIEIILPILDALMIIHSVGVLHRDISPDNIYITTEGDVKLLDFGAARQVFGEQSKSLSVVLKQGFAPFEQYQKRGKQGPWTDIYALGATIYYLICGKVPEEVMERLDHDELETPSEMGIEITSEIEHVLLKMLAVRIEHRYQSVMDVKNDLNLILNHKNKTIDDHKPNLTTESNEHSVIKKQAHSQKDQTEAKSFILEGQPQIIRNKKKKKSKILVLSMLLISMVAVAAVIVVTVNMNNSSFSEDPYVETGNGDYSSQPEDANSSTSADGESPINGSGTMTCSWDSSVNGALLEIEIDTNYVGDNITEQISTNVYTAETDKIYTYLLENVKKPDYIEKAKNMDGVTYEFLNDSSIRRITENISIDFNIISPEDYKFLTYGESLIEIGNKVKLSLAKSEKNYTDNGFTCTKY